MAGAIEKTHGLIVGGIFWLTVQRKIFAPSCREKAKECFVALSYRRAVYGVSAQIFLYSKQPVVFCGSVAAR